MNDLLVTGRGKTAGGVPPAESIAQCRFPLVVAHLNAGNTLAIVNLMPGIEAMDPIDGSYLFNILRSLLTQTLLPIISL